MGQFDSFVGGASEARFSGRAVESGWYFGVCGQSLDLDSLGGEEVSLLVVNEGPAIWVDYQTGSAFLEEGDSVVVYEGTLAHLAQQCDARKWWWVVFKGDSPGSGFINLLVVMRFGGAEVRVEQPVALNAWYAKVVNR